MFEPKLEAGSGAVIEGIGGGTYSMMVGLMFALLGMYGTQNRNTC